MELHLHFRTVGQVFSENCGFPYQFSFHRLFLTHPSFGAGAVGPIVGSVSPHAAKLIYTTTTEYAFGMGSFFSIPW
jgi:hypothetical protein